MDDDLKMGVVHLSMHDSSVRRTSHTQHRTVGQLKKRDEILDVAYTQPMQLGDYTQTRGSSPLAADAQTQRGVIDEHAPTNPTVADSSRNANEGEDEDEQDDEMLEPT